MPNPYATADVLSRLESVNQLCGISSAEQPEHEYLGYRLFFSGFCIPLSAHDSSSGAYPFVGGYWRAWPAKGATPPFSLFASHTSGSVGEYEPGGTMEIGPNPLLAESLPPNSDFIKLKGESLDRLKQYMQSKLGAV